MSGTFSTWLETALLNHVFAGTNFPPPAAIYVALYTAAPGMGGGGTELAGGNYARQPVTFTPPSGTSPAMVNPSQVQFSAASVTWGTLVAAGLFDAVTAGGFLGSAMLVDPTDSVTPKPVLIAAGDIFRIPPGALSVGFAPPLMGAMMGARTVIAPIGAEIVR